MSHGRRIRLSAVGVGLAVSLVSAKAGSDPGAAAPSLSRQPPAVRDCPMPEDRFRDVTALLGHWADRKRQLEDVPGLVVGLVCGPNVTWSQGFGLADREARLPATDTTLFRIASITKVFTAVAVLQLRDEGRLTLDDRVSDHLPWFELRNSDQMPAVTIRHLLTHTSGLPTNSTATDFNRMTQPTVEVARSSLPDQQLLFAPGTDANYSNLGFALLGQIVTSVSRRSSYRSHLEEDVFAPLGLDRTVAHPEPGVAQATGYHLRQPKRTRRPAEFLHLAAFTPAGGMATTANDMVRFMAFLLAPESMPGVISPGTLREMQRVHHWVDSARGGSGLAWAVEQRPDVHEIYHGGGLPTQTSHLRVDVHRGLGVIVLANAEDADPDSYAREALALLRLASDSADTVGNGRERPGAAKQRARGETGQAARLGPPWTEELATYVGRYRYQERELWVMELRGGLSVLDPYADRPSRSLVQLEAAGRHRFRLLGSVVGGGARGQMIEFVVGEDARDPIRLQLPNLLFRRVGPIPSST